MDPRRLTILGIGSLRCGPPTLAALASYFGERDLEVRLYDSDEERLDLADRLARTMFGIEEVKHLLLAIPHAEEALEGADAAIVMVEPYCATRYLHPVAQERRPYPSRLELEPVEDTGCGPIVGPGVPVPIVAPPIPDDDMAPALASMLDGFKGPVLSFVPVSMVAGSNVLSLQGWPEEPSAEVKLALPHQMLRWIRGEEYVGDYIKEHRRSPIRRWLDDVH